MFGGYISDERYVALEGVRVEFRRNGQPEAVVRSTPSGAVQAAIQPREYTVTLQKDGYGSKRTAVTFDPGDRPY